MRSSRAALALVVLALGCAQVREPTGGDKDAQPPHLLAADPPQGATRFSGDRIVLRFDERIRLDRPREKLLISPPLEKAPDVHLAGADAVVIDLSAPLEANTTYTFNIGDAVVDLSEANAAAGLVYVISTGERIDSLSVGGSVINAFTAKPERDVLVMLYDVRNDTAFRRDAPMYFTRSRTNGGFRVDHLRPGEYQLYALRDQNGNYRYDLPNEEIAFAEAPVAAVVLDSTSVPIPLRLFRETPAAQQVLDTKVTADRALRIVLAQPVHLPQLQPVDWNGGSLVWTVEQNPTRDTVLFWPSDTTLLDGRAFAVIDGDHPLDTVRYIVREKMPFTPDVRLLRTLSDDGPRYALLCSRPIRTIDEARILGNDAGVPPITITRVDSNDLRTIRFEERLPGSGSTDVILLPKAISDIYGGTNDTLRFSLSAPLEKETGTLAVTMLLDSTGLRSAALLQLLDAHDAPVRQAPILPGSTKVQWSLLPPGTYALKLIEDLDGDGRWTPGALAGRRGPERAWRYPESISLRAGWDLDTEWRLTGR